MPIIYAFIKKLYQLKNLIANSWTLFIYKKKFNFAIFLKQIKCPAIEIYTLFKVKVTFDQLLLLLFQSTYILNSSINKTLDRVEL